MRKRFYPCKLEHKIAWKSDLISFYRIVQSEGLNTVQFSQVRSQNHTLSSDDMNQRQNVLSGKRGFAHFLFRPLSPRAGLRGQEWTKRDRDRRRYQGFFPPRAPVAASSRGRCPRDW